MNLMFEREVIGETTRLVLEIGGREGLEQFALNMIDHNNIECLAPMEFIQYNDRNYLRYDISDKDTLENRLSRTLKKHEVIQILNSIISAFEETDAYMLSEGGMLLRIEHVYLTGQGRCIFLYLPFEQGDFVDRISFLKAVVEHITPNYEEKDAYLFNILNAFNRGAVRKVADLKEILRKNSSDLLSVDENARISGRGQKPEGEQISDVQNNYENPQIHEKSSVLGKLQIPGKAQASEKPQELEAIQIPVKQELKKPQSTNISFVIPGKNGDMSINIPEVKKDGGEKKENKKGKKKKLEQQSIKEEKRNNSKKRSEIPLFGKKGKETIEIQRPVVNRQEYIQNKNDDMYESYEQTVLMTEQPADDSDSEATVCLNISESIAQLERKSTGECLEITRNNAIIGSGIGADCQITGNKAISRTHATISAQNGAFFITDNHSSNGTWVNGSRLISDRSMELHTEALIKLANEEFIFRTR